ncbi:PepSY-associated TM helix domain-containing protein [Antribacter gilvus]|uniref:PepSY-associated TM helix domain-containing protein n=1 Tax=Antribacter gilvus TaxID=2304675 RepID=UPI000F78CD83|nr:PepSY domain-containing protein [Antribacter gilvus]
MTSVTTRTDETTSPPTPPDPSPSEQPATPGVWAHVRPLLHRLHFYAGILVGPFLVLAALTGLVYAATPTIEQVVHRHELFVDAPVAEPLSLFDQVQAARAVYPEGAVTQVRPAAAPDRTTAVVLAADDLPEGLTRTVFVDPGTLEVRGALATSGDALPFRAWVSELHASLHLGAAGRLYSETAASWLWVVVLGGLAMWVARVARTRRLRRLVVPEVRSARPHKRVLSWHGAVGTLIALVLLGLSATGLTWSAYAGENVESLRHALGWATPAVDPSLSAEAAAASAAAHEGHGDGGPAMMLEMGPGVNGVHSIARAEGLRAPLVMTPPADHGQAWVVRENQRQWPTQADAIAVNGNDGTTVDRLDFADYPLAAKLARWGIDAHMGTLFGFWNQVVLAVVAVGLVALVVIGYRLWWLRRPTSSASWRPGPAVPRGALRRAPLWLTVTVLALAAAVGVFLPLFGIPLAVFLLVDLALAARARRRAAA